MEFLELVVFLFSFLVGLVFVFVCLWSFPLCILSLRSQHSLPQLVDLCSQLKKKKSPWLFFFLQSVCWSFQARDVRLRLVRLRDTEYSIVSYTTTNNSLFVFPYFICPPLTCKTTLHLSTLNLQHYTSSFHLTLAKLHFIFDSFHLKLTKTTLHLSTANLPKPHFIFPPQTYKTILHLSTSNFLTKPTEEWVYSGRKSLYPTALVKASNYTVYLTNHNKAMEVNK